MSILVFSSSIFEEWSNCRDIESEAPLERLSFFGILGKSRVFLGNDLAFLECVTVDADLQEG